MKTGAFSHFMVPLEVDLLSGSAPTLRVFGFPPEAFELDLRFPHC